MPRGYRSEIGARRKTQNGYWETRTERGWVYDHILIMEEKLGRDLRSNERVYFIDGNRDNLVPGNLEVRTIKPKTREARIATLEAKLDDIWDELEDLYDEE
jgi:hypothetical protein